MAAPNESHDDSLSKSSGSLLAALLRRWPLLLLGTAVGLIAGFFYFLSQPPAYQSSAKVLVIKERVSAVDSRSTYVDDYVATQIPLIKSDVILAAAAKQPELVALSEPLPENSFLAASVLQAGLTVARDKEATAGSQGGSNILTMTYRARNPRDAYLLLTAVIDAYKRKLSEVYATQTRKEIANLEMQTRADNLTIQHEEAKKANLTQDLSAITGEDLAVIRGRVSTARDREFALELEIKELADQLDLIAKTGKNRRDRLAVLTLLGVPKQLGTDAASPESRMSALRAERKELSERLGKDHPQMKAIDAQLDYYAKLLEALNPDDPTGSLDELGQLERQLQRRLKTAKGQVEVISIRQKADEETLKRGGGVAGQIESLKADIARQRQVLSDRGIKLKSLQQMEKAEAAGGYEASVITPPRDGAKVSTGLIAWLIAGAVLGALLGFGLALLAEVTDKSFRSAAEIRTRLGVPLFGHLPPIALASLRADADAADCDPSLVVALRSKSMEAEAYRGVRAQLFVLTQNKGHQVIQITSPNPADGKSTLAANLAISIAQAGKRVILLDCDFRKPRIHTLFHLPKPELGLASVTDGQAELSTAIRSSRIEHLDLLPCGSRPSNPAELLSGAKFQQILAELRTLYDFVIVDTPPMLAVSDPRVVAQRADGVLMVFKITKRVRPQAERAREQLADMGANLMGVVINGLGTAGDRAGYNYHYAYDYEYADHYSDDDAPNDIVPLTAQSAET